MTSLAASEKMGAPSPTEAFMTRQAQLFIYAAIDRYIGQLAREGKSPATLRKYRQVLDPFADTVRYTLPSEITKDHVDRYVDRWTTAAPSTLALYVTVIRRFFEFCVDEGIVSVSPAARLKRPRRPRPEDLDVVSVTSADVVRLFAACADDQERLAIGVPAFMGCRATAAANVRRRDVDLDRGLMRFREKGRKVISKPIPDEFLEFLRALDEAGYWLHGDEWLIPWRRPQVAKPAAKRSRKIVYETIVRVGDRARIRVHAHALRAAFAVMFDEMHPDHLRALKELLGHARIETTMTYLRRASRVDAMEHVRDLSFGSVLPPNAVMPRTGFEPVFPTSRSTEPARTETGDRDLADALLEEARSKAKDEKSSDPVSQERTP